MIKDLNIWFVLFMWWIVPDMIFGWSEELWTSWSQELFLVREVDICTNTYRHLCWYWLILVLLGIDLVSSYNCCVQGILLLESVVQQQNRINWGLALRIVIQWNQRHSMEPHNVSCIFILTMLSHEVHNN